MLELRNLSLTRVSNNIIPPSGCSIRRALFSRGRTPGRAGPGCRRKRQGPRPFTAPEKGNRKRGSDHEITLRSLKLLLIDLKVTFCAFPFCGPVNYTYTYIHTCTYTPTCIYIYI